jgi:ribonuclease BN (tRNA processing enzyme)
LSDEKERLKIEILGCSGGIGPSQHTTCLRINDQMLIDAGSGLGNLPAEQHALISDIFITHAHLDHVCFLPMFLDGLFEQHSRPIRIHGLAGVLETLQQHLFNWKLWPDFSALPSPENPLIRYHLLQLNQTVKLDGLKITPVLARHTVSASGYRLEDDHARMLFSGDTTYDADYLQLIESSLPLDLLIIECAFPDRLEDLALRAGHLTPSLLGKLLGRLSHPPKRIGITHIKPTLADEVRRDLDRLHLGERMVYLSCGQSVQI